MDVLSYVSSVKISKICVSVVSNWESNAERLAFQAIV